MSGEKSAPANLGLYKQTFTNSYTRPQATTATQKYVKIITNYTSQNGKLYSFQTVQNSNQDPEMPLWISRVSQYCMGDEGGSKSLLQFRWTSLLSAHLFCGNKVKRMTFPELLDVAELETQNDTIIYALFKNAYNIRAVCIYQMSEISRIFISSKFRHPKDPIPGNPGECVSGSPSLPSTFLNFMQQRPEMEEWVVPERGPFVFNHHLYSHIQVDKINEEEVLFMTLESGKIHKVLVQEDDHFTIAEYLPFDKKTHIHSMLLDKSNKKLYVSNSSQVVQIDVQDCSQYGDSCHLCRLAKDPYCNHQCPSATGASAEGVFAEGTVCAEEGKPITKRVMGSPRTPDLIIPQHSKYYLTCPTLSKHASYTWIHENSSKLECVSTEEQCLLLIESMSHTDEGTYVCQATEEGQTWTITSYSLVGNGASNLGVPALMTCLLLLISVMIF